MIANIENVISRQWRIQRGAEGPPKIALKCDKARKQKFNSGTILRTKMADHFLETPEFEQFKYPGLVYLKVIKSIRYMNLKNKFCWSVDPATFMPPLTNIPGSAHGLNAGLDVTRSFITFILLVVYIYIYLYDYIIELQLPNQLAKF